MTSQKTAFAVQQAFWHDNGGAQPVQRWIAATLGGLCGNRSGSRTNDCLVTFPLISQYVNTTWIASHGC
jgi:hypothetical protein